MTYLIRQYNGWLEVYLRALLPVIFFYGWGFVCTAPGEPSCEHTIPLSPVGFAAPVMR